MPHAGPALGDRVVADHRVEVGQRAVGVEVGQVAVPQLLEELDRGLRRYLGRRTSWAISAASASVSPSTNVAAGRISSSSRVRPYLAQPALDVGVEGLPVLQRGVPGEDGVGRGGGELAALVGVAGLEDHRAALRAAGHVELPGDVEVRVVVREAPRRAVGQELPGLLVGHDLVAAPGVPQLVAVVCRNVRARS